MRLTRALSRPVEHRVMHVDLPASRLAGSWKEYVLETSLVFASSLLTLAMLVPYAVIVAVTGDSSAAWARLLDGAGSGLIFAGILLAVLHIVRYMYWYGRSGPQRRGEPGGEVGRRVPLLMSTDWDFALALAVVLASALAA